MLTVLNGMKMKQNWCQRMNDQVKLNKSKPNILENKINVAFMLRKLAGVGTVYQHDEDRVKWWKLTVTFGNKEYYICFQYYLTKPGVDRVDIRDTSTWKALKVTEIKWLESQLKQKLNGTHNGKNQA